MLKLKENNQLPILDAFCITGELALSGQLRPVKGVLSIALEAKRRGRQTLVVPLENAAEAPVVEGVDVYSAFSLSQVVHFFRGDIALEPVRSTNGWPEAGSAEQDLDFSKVKGQKHVKRAVEVADNRSLLNQVVRKFGTKDSGTKYLRAFYESVLAYLLDGRSVAEVTVELQKDPTYAYLQPSESAAYEGVRLRSFPLK